MRDAVHSRGWLVVTVVLVGGGLVLALDPPTRSQPQKTAAAAKPTPAAPESAKARKEEMRVVLTLKGVFAPEDMHEVTFHPKATTLMQLPGGLTVLEAASHGSTVKKGDVLVRLDTEKIDQAIKDRKADHALARLSLDQNEKELPLLEQSQPLDLAAAERASKQADEDYRYFLNVDRPLSAESAEEMVKNATYRLEAAREELKQLQNMYRDKDLTEATEEYILKRQRQEVQSATFWLKSATIRRDFTLQVSLPRQETSLKDATVRQSLALDRAKFNLPIALDRAKLDLQKARESYRKSGEQLKHLEADRAAMTVRSPADGIVYYGKPTDGQWPAVSSIANRLRPHGQVMPDEVFMTVVTSRPLIVQASVDEKDLHWLHAGLSGKATPTGYPRMHLPTRLTSVSAVPTGPNKFDARLTVEPGKHSAVMPGMSCEIKLVVYHKQHALTVPSSAVFGADDSHYVYLAHSHKKQPVKVGEMNNDRTEILSGVEAGTEILLKKPE